MDLIAVHGPRIGPSKEAGGEIAPRAGAVSEHMTAQVTNSQVLIVFNPSALTNTPSIGVAHFNTGWFVVSDSQSAAEARFDGCILFLA
jgi:hypothetical protein